MFTIEEVAERYQVKGDTVRKWIRQGELGAINVSPSPSSRPRYRISQSALGEFERLRAITDTPASPGPDLSKLVKYV